MLRLLPSANPRDAQGIGIKHAMKFSPKKARAQKSGYALLIVMLFSAIGLVILAAIMSETATNSALIQRNNEYFDSVEASEAATEKVLSEITSDFLDQGAATVNGKMSVYHSRVPQSTENPKWAKFLFKDTHGNQNATEVDLLSGWTTNTALISQYQGLVGDAETYRITSYAKDLDGNVSGGVQQDLQLATASVFQFAIFYNMDLEINPGAAMTVTGRVHGNQNIYLQPPATLTFNNDVTSAGNIIAGKSPGDPTIRAPGTIVFDAAHDSGVNSLNLPIGTDNSPASVHAIVEIPPNNESKNSLMGQQRLYNQADLIILVTDSGVSVNANTSGNGNGAPVKWSAASAFINIGTNVMFYDQREGKTINTTQIDIGALAASSAVQQAVGGVISSVYIDDQRTQSSSTEPGVRLVDGQTLPADGLTVVTPDPLYVEGDYNVVNSARGTSNTSQSKPAALIGDSINILSGNWNDANSKKSLGYRTASDTTVNAAFLAGIVPSGNGYYSGGVENFPRFLENWSNKKFTYNGSMVVMFPSEIATAPWKGTGSIYNIYNTPVRNWNFDLNFYDPAKLPPISPRFSTAIRGAWASIPAN